MSIRPAVPARVRRAWPALRLACAAAFLAVLGWRFGTGPFVDAWHVTEWPAVLAALVLTFLATLTSSWRWRVVARRLGVPVRGVTSVAAYYRSQLLNSTLPGGVLGDAHRAVRHGREVGDVRAGLSATLWERVTGQTVQVALMCAALALVPSPLRGLAPAAVGASVLVVCAGWCLRPRAGAAGRGLVEDVRALCNVPSLVRIVVASGASTVAHLAVFLVAVHSVGVSAPWTLLVPTTLVVLVGSSLPVNIAGWGLREGVTVWAFGAAGLGASDGLTVSVAYGVLATVSTLPGAFVLAADGLRRGDGHPVTAAFATPSAVVASEVTRV